MSKIGAPAPTKAVRWGFGHHTSPVVIFLVALLGAYGQTAIGILPVMVSGWVEGLGFTDRAAGFIGSATLAGMTVGLAASVLMLRRRSHAWIAALGIFIALLSDTLSIWQQTAMGLGGVRFTAGLGYGLVVASVVSWFARHEMADRCFGTFMLLQLLVFAPLITVVPLLESRIGSAAPYLCLLALGAICLTLLPLLKLNQDKPREEKLRTSAPSGFLPGSSSGSLANAAILAPAVLVTATVGFWAFLQRYGISLGIEGERLGVALGAVTLTGIPAALAIIWLGDRLGRLIPVLIGLAGLLVPIAMFWSGISSFTAFVIGGILFTMGWSFSIPCMQSIQADLDNSGQLAAMSTIPQAIGSALGPAAFAIALSVGRYSMGFGLVIVLLLITLAMVIPAALEGERLHAGKPDSG